MVADELTCAAGSSAELNAAAFTSVRCDNCLQLKRHAHDLHAQRGDGAWVGSVQCTVHSVVRV